MSAMLARASRPLVQGTRRISRTINTTSPQKRGFTMYHLCQNEQLAGKIICGGGIVGGVAGAVIGAASNSHDDVAVALMESVVVSALGVFLGGAITAFLPCVTGALAIGALTVSASTRK